MKKGELKKRAAALLLSVGVAVTQLMTGQPGTMIAHAEESQTTGINQALLLYLAASDLGGAPKNDAEALKAIFAKTNEFDESNIEIHEMPENSPQDDKSAIWEKISAMAENTDENSFTVISYSGHGNSNLDGTSYLAAGGVNNISAAELREHLDELQGRVLVVIHACYSGGMIMTASEYEDGQEVRSSFSDTDFMDEFLAQEYTPKKANTDESASKDASAKKAEEKKTEKASDKEASDQSKTDRSAEKTSQQAADTEKSSAEKADGASSGSAEKADAASSGSTERADGASSGSTEKANAASSGSTEKADGASSGSIEKADTANSQSAEQAGTADAAAKESTSQETSSTENKETQEQSAVNATVESVQAKLVSKAIEADSVIVRKSAALKESSVKTASTEASTEASSETSLETSAEKSSEASAKASTVQDEAGDASSEENTGTERTATGQDTAGKENSEAKSTEKTAVEASDESSSENIAAGTSSPAKKTSSVENASALSSSQKTEEEQNSSTKTVSNPPRYYFITASNQLETGWSQANLGTEMIAAFGHAMGYDRNNSAYNIYAADTETSSGRSSRAGYQGDGAITMAELEYYLKNQCSLTSTPTIYPSGNEDVLFTYEENAGYPASFKCSIPSENIKVGSDGKIEVKIEIQNLTGQTLSIDSGVYALERRTFAFTTESPDEYVTGQEGYYASEYEPTEIKPNSTASAIFAFTSEDFADGISDGEKNPFCIKVWECTGNENGSIGNYGVLSFYTMAADGEEDQIDPDAFSLRTPLQLTAKSAEEDYTIIKTSSTLSMQIVYDQEYGDKNTNAGCLLSVYAYDLGDALPQGLHVIKDSQDYADVLVYGADDKQVSLTEDDRITVFKNVRPTHDRIEKGDSSIRGSIHTYVMDTTDLEQDHYYALEFVCHDDATQKDNTIYAIIQRTDAAQTQEYQIPSIELSYDVMDGFRRGNGLPAQENWGNTYNDEAINVKKVNENLEESLQDSGNNRYDFKVSDWEVKTSSAPDKWEKMEDDDKFSPDNTYRCTIQVSVSKGNNAVFTQNTWFKVDHHTIENVQLSDDYKTATFQMIHQVPSEESMEKATLEMYRIENNAVGKKVASDDENLHSGDQVILVPGENDVLSDAYGLTKTGNSIRYNGKKYTIYKVNDIEKGKTSDSVICTVWKEEEGSCGCAQTLYLWTAHPKAEGGSDGASSGGSSSGSSGDSSSSSSSSSSSASSGGSSDGGGNSGSGSSDNHSSGGGSSENSASGSGASGNKAATTAKTISAAEAQVLVAPAAASTAGSSAADGSSVAAVQSKGIGIKSSPGTSASGASSKKMSDTEESAGKSTIEEEADGEKSVILSEEDKTETGENNLDENADGQNDTSKNAEQKGHMFWIYLILIWILAVLLGFIIFILLKRKKDKEEEQN